MTSTIELEVGADGYVIGPATFHDAEVVALYQTKALIEVTIQKASTDQGLRNLTIRCEGPKYLYLSSAFCPSVIFGLWQFDRIWDRTYQPPIENGARGEFENVRRLIETTTSFLASQQQGKAIWFEPCMENPILVICSRATVRFDD